jgi:hypothetical protein
VIDGAGTPTALLAVWERGRRERPGSRALTLLLAAPESVRARAGSLTVGGRDAALLDVRERLFGREFAAVSSCPSCGEDIELAFAAREVRRETASVDRSMLHVAGVHVQFRLPTGDDVAAIEAAPDVATARAGLVARCFAHAVQDHVPIAIDQLPAPIVDAVIARMAELDPQADVALDVACPWCGYSWLEPFDIVSFLWSELAAWARRLLNDVHVIASAYGWSEHDILALTPARRSAYLEMVR